MRPRLSLFLAGALSLVAPPVVDAGIDLSWNSCVGHPTASTRRDFSCSGTFNNVASLILQFKLYKDIENFVGLAAYVDLQLTSHLPLTPFWRFERGGCNQTGVALFDRLPASCEAICFIDPWDGDGSGGFEGIAAYGVDFRRPGNGYFIMGIARETPIRLQAGQNYFAMELRFNNGNRSTCAGCSEPAVVVFHKLELESNDGQPRVDLETPDKLGQCVGLNADPGCECGWCHPCPPFCPIAISGSPCDETPVRRPTWRALKMLYR